MQLRNKAAKVITALVAAGALAIPIQAQALQLSLCSLVNNTMCCQPQTLLEQLKALLGI